MFAVMNWWTALNERLFPDLLWYGSREQKVVYLTFDDGPHPDITPWVMEQLDQHNAKATFFVVGANVERYPETTELLIEKGHTLGNHTQHHVKGWSVSAEEYIDDIAKCDNMIPEGNLFRPPYGRFNMKALPQIIANHTVVMWDILSFDYRPGLNVERAMTRLKQKTANGSIVVFHDSLKAQKNLEQLLPEYLDFLVSEGYEMRAL